jgi:hypothetical protein
VSPTCAVVASEAPADPRTNGFVGNRKPPLSNGDGKSIGLNEIAMRLLLLVPFVALLWVPIFNRELPPLFGLPFFYWYQIAWVPLTTLLMWIVYRRDVREGIE